MIEDPLAALAVITTAAILCQWLGNSLNLPSVLFLLAAGVSLSPLLDPDEIFGELLFVGVGLGVAILLFEGGAGLNWRRLRRGRAAVIRLVTVGALIAWAVGAGASALLLDIDVSLAILMGAILIVSGPTVIMPLLRVVRPREPTRSVLQWEGILIDPVGAGLAIVVLDAIISERTWFAIVTRVFTTFGTGLAVGALFSVAVLFIFRRHLVDDHLHVPVTLAAVIGAYALTNGLRPEAGLIAVTVLGMAFANQRSISATHIQEFNENLGSTVLGVLFIVLGARVEIDDVIEYLPVSIAIALALMVVARPLTILASTIGTEVEGRDRWFLMSLAPRGVVAAAVASLFALELEHNDIDPGPLVPVVFTIVVITVAVAGTTARFWAHQFRVAQPSPKGVAIIGGGQFGFELADALGELHVPTLHVGLSDDEALQAAEHGQLSFKGRLDSGDFDQTVTAVGIASAVALSGSDHLDGYVASRLSNLIGSSNVFGLANDVAESHGSIRLALPPEVDATALRELSDAGAHIRSSHGPQPEDDHWTTICVVDADGNVSFSRRGHDTDEDDTVIQLDISRVRNEAR